jgi:hypothetical protein
MKGLTDQYAKLQSSNLLWQFKQSFYDIMEVIVEFGIWKTYD